jgi:DNA-binding IclR family transcriptional regulator
VSPREASPSPAVTRAVDVLAAISNRGAMTMSELGAQSGLRKSSIADITSTLQGNNVLIRAADGKYALGPAFAQLIAAAAGDEQIYDLFDAAVASEMDLGGMTYSLHMLYGSEATCIAVRLGNYPLVSTPRAGQRSAGPTSAIVRAILQKAPTRGTRIMRADFAAHEGQSIDTLEAEFHRTSDPARGAQIEETASGGVLLAVGVDSPDDDPLFCAVALHIRVEDYATLGERGEAAVARVAEGISRSREGHPSL